MFNPSEYKVEIVYIDMCIHTVLLCCQFIIDPNIEEVSYFQPSCLLLHDWCNWWWHFASEMQPNLNQRIIYTSSGCLIENVAI